MKNTCQGIFIAMLFALCSNSLFSQQVNPKIQEIYGDKTQELVLNNPDQLVLFNDLLDNRISIIESAFSLDEKFIKLSEIALLNKYNSSLTRDIVFDPLNFNPLKYNLIFLPKTPMVYRVDNTNYLIVIEPQVINKN